MPLQTGQMLNNRYRIVKLLGEGGFGAVYRAWDVNFQLPCALKENNQVSQSSQRQFLREARILHTLRHPSLPLVKDYFLIPDQGQYLVMDYIEGDDLQSMLDQNARPLSTSKVIQWLCEVCGALDYMHGQSPPVIHRDIKPANIKITPQGKAILVDFGISKEYDPGVPTTLGAQAVTPGFSPFEQYGHAPTDSRTDIYALGATAYVLLTSQIPPESISRLAGVDLPSPSSLNPSLPANLERVILRAMQLSPADRYDTATQFCQEMRAAEQSGVQHVNTPALATLFSSPPETIIVPEEPLIASSEKTSKPSKIEKNDISGKVQRKKESGLWKPGLFFLIGLALVAGAFFLGQVFLKDYNMIPQLPEEEEPVENISGEWFGFVEESHGEHHRYEMRVILEQNPPSDHLECHIEVMIEPDFWEPRECGGTLWGRELRLADQKEQHYWGIFEGERIVGDTAWGCFECEPWGFFELYR